MLETRKEYIMKKPSLIIGKKQIILSCLTLMLAIAVYVNYAMSDGKLETAQVQSKDSVTYGDTAFVNAEAEQSEPAAEDSTPTEESAADGAYSTNGEAPAEETAAEVEADYAAAGSAENYFAQARLERTSSRDESVAALQSMLGAGDRTEDELVTDAIAAVETSKLIESESTIESLIQAQGYSNCIVYLDGDSAKVVVQTEGLDAAQAAAIKDLQIRPAEDGSFAFELVVDIQERMDTYSRLWRVLASGSIHVIERSWPHNPHGLLIEPYLENNFRSP